MRTPTTRRRYDRAEEFVTALRRLWDSWSEDAWIADAERGVLIDPDGLRGADLQGAHVRVTGPLNVARPPQGQIPIVHAGTSPRSRALAATEADLALIAAPNIADAIATRRAAPRDRGGCRARPPETTEGDRSGAAGRRRHGRRGAPHRRAPARSRAARRRASARRARRSRRTGPVAALADALGVGGGRSAARGCLRRSP